MVAYSYKRRFVPAIQVGLANSLEEIVALNLNHSPAPKRQTIRGPRGGHGHAKPGQLMHHFCGMRTEGCFLIGIGRCIGTNPIHLSFKPDKVECHAIGIFTLASYLDRFAKLDGFIDWTELRSFWRENHQGVNKFEGFLIRWEPIRRANNE
jgi:hypothetical protein